MPKLRHLKKSFDLLSESEAIELVRQTRRDRESWIKPKAVKKKVEAEGLEGRPKAARKKAAAKPGARTRKPKGTALDAIAALAAMPLEQQRAIMAKLGIKI